MKTFYTKTGDKGETTLRNGKRYSKADPRVEAIGAVDELNSTIALAIAQIHDSRFTIQEELLCVQSDLFHIGSLLSGEENSKSGRVKYLKNRVGKLEEKIDKIQKGLPVQEGFVLPGGAKPSAQLDFARAVCRRAERRVAALNGGNKVIVKPGIVLCLVKYLNRLSDYLYALARWTNFKLGKDEIKWKNNFYSST